MADFASAEKSLLQSKETHEKIILTEIREWRPAVMFQENANLALLYTYSNPEMGADFADSEIQAIYEKKRQYDQDEGYFTWLDLYSQPKW